MSRILSLESVACLVSRNAGELRCYPLVTCKVEVGRLRGESVSTHHECALGASVLEQHGAVLMTIGAQQNMR